MPRLESLIGPGFARGYAGASARSQQPPSGTSPKNSDLARLTAKGEKWADDKLAAKSRQIDDMKIYIDISRDRSHTPNNILPEEEFAWEAMNGCPKIEDFGH